MADDVIHHVGIGHTSVVLLLGILSEFPIDNCEIRMLFAAILQLHILRGTNLLRTLCEGSGKDDLLGSIIHTHFAHHGFHPLTQQP